MSFILETGDSMDLIQRYVSKELTHFVGRHKPEEERFQLLIEIIQSGEILPPVSESFSKVTLYPQESSLEAMISPAMVCFADIPINDLSLHMEKYSNFGIAFKKDYLVKYGANPVLYVVQNGKADETGKTRDMRYRYYLKQYARLKEEIRKLSTVEEMNGIKELFTELDQFLMEDMFSYIKPFDALKSDADEDNYYLEREWRIIGNLPFTLKDVTRILIPEKYGKKLQEALPDYYGQISFTE